MKRTIQGKKAGKGTVLDRIIDRHKAAHNALIAVFQDVQEQEGYISEETLRYVSRRLGIPPSRAFAVATFYRAFTMKPQGRNHIHVCLGTACHIRGARHLIERAARELQILPGETTADGRFTLHEVRCLGCCALAPVVRINDDTHAGMTQDTIPQLLEKYV